MYISKGALEKDFQGAFLYLQGSSQNGGVIGIVKIRMPHSLTEACADTEKGGEIMKSLVFERYKDSVFRSFQQRR